MRPVIADARRLRANQTRAEAALWNELRGRRLGPRFRRQHPFDCYVLDFFCREASLVIEIDGDAHATEDAPRRDAERTRVLERHGLRVIRFTNQQVLSEMPRVLQRIFAAIQAR
jgi:cyclase